MARSKKIRASKPKDKTRPKRRIKLRAESEVRLELKVFSLIFLGIFLLVTYQNCGKVEFENTLSSEERKRISDCSKGCWENTLNPDEIVDKPEVKVLFVVDNSFSMSQAQDKLARGVQSLIESLKGFTASYYLYSTSQDGDKAVATERPGCEKLKNGVTTEITNCPTSNFELGAIYTQYKKWDLTPSLTTGSNFKISSTASSSEFSSLKSRLASAIIGMGVAGNDSERGICTLLLIPFRSTPRPEVAICLTI